MTNIKYFIISLLFITSCKKHFIEPTKNCIDNLNFIESSENHPLNEKLQLILDKYMHKGIPGATLLFSNNQGVWIGSSGYADLNNNIKMQPCHIMKPGSVTKMLVGNIIWQLQENGDIKIENYISEYVPDIASKITNGNKITVEMLMNHTSGIYPIARDLEYNLAVVNNFTKSWNADEIIKYFENKPATNEPGEKYYYCNTNTLILELIIETITEKPIEEVLNDRIFIPLNMNNTVYYDYSEKFPKTNLAQGYFDFHNDGGSIQNISDLNPGSGNGYTGLYSNAEDMFKFAKAVFIDYSLISENSLNQILNSFFFSESGKHASSSGSIHRQDIDFFGDSIIAYGHSGGDIGYSSNLTYIPMYNTILVINYNYGTQFSSLIGEEITNLKKEIYFEAISH